MENTNEIIIYQPDNTSIGYRVKSSRGVQFRVWANKALKEMEMPGEMILERIKTTQRLYN